MYNNETKKCTQKLHIDKGVFIICFVFFIDIIIRFPTHWMKWLVQGLRDLVSPKTSEMRAYLRIIFVIVVLKMSALLLCAIQSRKCTRVRMF